MKLKTKPTTKYSADHFCNAKLLEVASIWQAIEVNDTSIAHVVQLVANWPYLMRNFIH